MTKTNIPAPLAALRKAVADGVAKHGAITEVSAVTEHDTDKLANAREQAMAQYASICEMVDALQTARDADDNDAIESAEQAIQEDALSVEVRSDWVSPGEKMTAGQFNILLCTGGPAVRIMGDLNQYGEPMHAWLECQDWGTPWTEVHSANPDVLLAYASCFYFGEG